MAIRIFPPVEVSYDDFTEDTEMNRLIKAAIVRLGRMRIRSRDARTRLRAFDQVLGQVADVEYQQGAIPDFSFNRLNRHYEPAIRLAQLILRSTSIEFSRGGVRAASFLVDMNKVFEDFMVVALRESLGLSERGFPQGASGRQIWLARDRVGRDRVGLEPDISWWEGSRCVFVGDLKYKKTDSGIPNADLYQLLAYTIAADLPVGLLIYAQGEEDPITHTINHVGKRMEFMTVELSGRPDGILAEVDRIAGTIRYMRLRALRRHAA